MYEIGADRVTAVLSCNTSMQHLNRPSCNLYENGFYTICKFLSATSKLKTLKLFIVNYSLNKTHDFDIIVSAISRLPISSLSTVYFYNNSLKLQYIAKAIGNLPQISLFIEDSDFKLQEISCDNESDAKLIGEIVVSRSEVCGCLQLQWIPFEATNVMQIEFCFKHISMMKFGVIMAQKFQKNLTNCRLRLTNCQITNETVKDIVKILAISDVDYLELINLNLSDCSLITILKLLDKVYSLQYITINSINFTYEHCKKYIATLTKRNPCLESIKICNCNLAESAITEICAAINCLRSLKLLNLANNIISNTAASKLADAFKTLTNLKHLDLSSTNLHEEAVIKIINSLSRTRLDYLSLNNCNITNIAAVDIASWILTDLDYLTSLELSNCNLDEESLLCILEALISLSSLCELNLKFNVISEMAAIKLARVISNNSTITKLKLTLTYTSVAKIASPCRALSSLHFIDWNFSSFFYSHFNCSSEFCLESVILNANVNTENNCYASIEKGIKEITHLTFTNCGCAKYFAYLELLSSLQHLDVNTCRLPYDVISNTIKSNAGLKHVNVSYCYWEKIVYDPYILEDDMFYEVVKSLASLQQLEHINISGNKVTDKIAEAIAVAIYRNKRLQHLDLSRCQMQSAALQTVLNVLIDLNHLRYLDVSFNHFTKEAMKNLRKMIANNKELVNLKLVDCQLNENECIVNENSSQLLKHLRFLELKQNILTTKVILTLTKVITINAYLQHLDISHCKLAEEAMMAMINCLKSINSLKHLNISSCVLSCCAAEHLAIAISGHKQLEHLNLGSCQLKNAAIKEILLVLKDMLLLNYINLESNSLFTSDSHEFIPLGGAVKLATVINNNTFLEYINLSHCGLSGSDVTCITTALSGLSYLQYVNISHNTITDEAAVGVASVITKNPSLEHFYMSNCCMEEYGIKKVVEALLVCKYLRSLDLSKNHIDLSAAEIISKIIYNNRTLDYLNFTSCSLKQSGVFDIIFNDHIALNYKPKHLYLGSNSMSNISATVIASILCSSAVEHLDLSFCQLEISGLLEILYPLEKIESLQYLNLSGNRFTEDAASILQNVIFCNRNIKQLNLQACHLTGKLLGEIINRCRALQHLDISCNILTDEVADFNQSNDSSKSCKCDLQHSSSLALHNALLSYAYKPILKEVNLCGMLMEFTSLVQLAQAFRCTFINKLKFSSTDDEFSSERSFIIDMTYH